MRTEVDEIGAGRWRGTCRRYAPDSPAKAWNWGRPEAGYRGNRDSRRTWRPARSPGRSICRACSRHRRLDMAPWQFPQRSGSASRKATDSGEGRACPGGTRYMSVSAWSCRRARGGRPARPDRPGHARWRASRSSIFCVALAAGVGDVGLHGSWSDCRGRGKHCGSHGNRRSPALPRAPSSPAPDRGRCGGNSPVVRLRGSRRRSPPGLPGGRAIWGP